MTSRRLGSVWHLPLVCLLVTTAWADKLTDRNATRYGKLFTITPVEVLFDPGCNSSQRVRVPLADLMRVDFDDNCQPSEHNFTSSPITLPCPGEEATLFKGRRLQPATSAMINKAKPNRFMIFLPGKQKLLGRQLRSITSA